MIKENNAEVYVIESGEQRVYNLIGRARHHRPRSKTLRDNHFKFEVQIARSVVSAELELLLIDKSTSNP